MSGEKKEAQKKIVPARSKGKTLDRIIIAFLLWISLLTLAIGIFAPVMTFKRLVFYKTTFSIRSGLVALFKEGEYILFLVIFVFTIMFPVMKIALLFLIRYYRAWSQVKKKKFLHYLNLISKWSMLDVFIVALLVVIVRLGIMGKVEVRWGIYVFAVSVILSALVTQRLTRRAENFQSM